MQFAIKCLIGIALLVSPCAYDSDPLEPGAITAIVAKVSNTPLKVAVSESFASGKLLATVTV